MGSDIKPVTEEGTVTLNSATSLPLGWSWTSLGAVAAFVNGDRGSNYPKHSDYVDSGIPFVNTGHITPSGRLDLGGMQYINQDKYDKLRSGKLQKGDIVYCLRGSTIGKIARVDLDEGAIASSLVIIRTNARVLQEYVYYLLASPFGQELVGQYNNGSAQPNLSVSIISKFPVLLPPVSDQKAIVKVLGVLDNKTHLNRQINQTLEQMAQTLFKSWFVDFDPVIDNALDAGNLIPDELQHRAEQRKAVRESETKPLPDDIRQLFPDAFEESDLGWVPEGWSVGTLASITEYGSERTSAESLSLESYISTENMLQNKQGVCDAAKLPTVKTVPKYSTGHILVSNIRPYFKKIWLARGQGGYSNDVLGFTRKNKGTEEFLFNLLYQDTFFDYMMTTSKGSKMPRGDKKAIMEWPIVIPCVELQYFFSEKVKGFYESTFSKNTENETLTNLRDTLLPKLISGELRLDQLDTASFDEATAVKETETA